MKNFVLVSALVFATFGVASAQTTEILAGDLVAVDHFDIGVAENHTEPSVGYPYSNVTNFTGSAVANGGAVAGSAPITRLIADDLTPVGLGGQAVTAVTFAVANFNTVAVQVRARIRFWNADGAGGAPGSYYSNPAAVGFSFNLFNFSPGVTILTGTIGAGLFNMPSGTFWAGLTFDNNSNAAGAATVAQLNNFGCGLFNPPTVGSSADAIFTTTAPGSFFPTPNPAGALSNFGGNPVANVGWRFEAVPEPGSLVAIGAGLAALAARRRRQK